MSQKKMGEILLENQLISEQQLQEALEMQKSFPGQTIGQLLVKLGFLNEADLSYILEQTGKRQKLADILLKEKLLTGEQLSHARTISKQDSISLEKALLRLRFLDEVQLAKTVAIEYDLSFVHIGSLTIDPELAKYLNASYAQKQKIVPISKIGNTLTLAMSQPLKLQELKDLESTIRLKIIPVITPESEILQAQQRLYKSVAAEQPQDTFEFQVAPDSIGDILVDADAFAEPEVDEEARKVTEKDSIIVKLVNKIIFDAYSQKASDIHIEPYPGKQDVVVRLRVDGRCKTYQRIPYKYKFAIPSRIKIMAELDIAERRRPQDGKINFKKFGPLDLELRVATMPTAGQLEDVVLRLLSAGGPVPFEGLGLTARNTELFERSIRQPYGLILVVGPTGSGKTTTLHAAVARINQPDLKIWTAEDPVEITQPGLRQVQVNPKIGFSFAGALRSFLRLDPDVILVGEMRDEETASTAIEASLTGHLVLSTLHTNSAAETVVRLLEIGLDPFSFSDSLLCIVAQRLARTLCPNCRDVSPPTPEELDALIEEYGPEAFARADLSLGDIVIGRPVGCLKCGNTGYSGRIGIHELLETTDSVKNLIKKRATSDAIRDQAMADGMTTLKQDGILKVFQGVTDIQEIRRVCMK
jgi:type II secretory ATPase GspE/PulE/Tfp pilus assembly ATPase PilB-like protein